MQKNSFDKATYTRHYNKSNYKPLSLRFNITTEKDLIDRIAREESPKEYISRLIRADIKSAERRNPRIIVPRSSRRPPKKAASYQHNHLNEYPYEVLESLPGGGYRSLAYATDMDEAAVLIMGYCDRGTPSGAIVIAAREVLRRDLKNNKAGMVYAKK